MAEKNIDDLIKILQEHGLEVVPASRAQVDMPQRHKTKYFLSAFEAKRLESIPELTDKVIIRLGTRLGLRVSEMYEARMGHLEHREVKDEETGEKVDLRFLHVWGKLTHQRKGKGAGEKKHRMVYLDIETWDLIEELNETFDLVEGKDHLALKPDGTRFCMSGLRHRIYKIARDAGVGLKEDGVGTFVSPHDLRRFWATNGLQVKQIPIPVMMDQGGWGSYTAMKPYQAKPTPDITYKALKKGDAL
jgi:integrase